MHEIKSLKSEKSVFHISHPPSLVASANGVAMCEETRALATSNYTSYSFIPQQPLESKMNRVDEINAQIAKLEAEREDAMLTEKANVLAKMKADIKLYGFKTSDFKGVLATRAKRRPNGTRAVAKKTVAKKSAK